jgi:Na+-driven multidrug efflux pump
MPWWFISISSRASALTLSILPILKVALTAMNLADEKRYFCKLMESAAAIKDLKVKVTNRQILSIALPITFAILIPQINMLTNNIFLGRSDDTGEALGNAGITGVYYASVCR